MKLLSFGEILFDVFPDKACIGGAPLNLAAHSFLQGVESYALSAVGDDELGEKALSEVRALGVNTEYIYKNGEKETGKCLVTLDKNGVPSYDLLTDVAYDYIPFTEELENEKFDILAFGTLALRSSFNMETLRRILASGTCREIYSDLNIRPPFYSDDAILFCLKNASIVKISDEELPIVTKAALRDEPTYKEAMTALADAFRNIKLIIVTRGDKGSCAYDTRSGEFYYSLAEPTEVASTVGAGDSFGASVLAGLARGRSIEECLSVASRVSAFVVSKQGAIPEEMKEFLSQI